MNFGRHYAHATQSSTYINFVVTVQYCSFDKIHQININGSSASCYMVYSTVTLNVDGNELIRIFLARTAERKWRKRSAASDVVQMIILNIFKNTLSLLLRFIAWCATPCLEKQFSCYLL